MTTFHSFAQYRAVMRQRISRIEKLAQRNPLRASSFATLHNKRMAPRKSGRLLSNIRKIKRGPARWVVESWVPGDFKYNLWVNENIRTVRLPVTSNFKTGPRVARTYKSTRHTGTPGYFDKAAKMTARFYHNLNVNLVKEAVGGTI